MPFNLAEARKHLQAFDLKKLFIEQMGWDLAKQAFDVEVNGLWFQLTMIAQKRGFAAFLCSPLPDGSLPDSALRAKIETQARKLAHEHLIVFANRDRSVQRWQWVRREPGKPIARREYEVSQGKAGDALLHRLQNLVFELEDEENLTILDVGQKARKAFDVEKVTKRFYDRFKTEHAAFMRFIKGIPDEEMQRWYVSVTLNRLMFLYFIQKKRFLDDDPDYLRHRLEQSKRAGRDRFYADFLCPLFFEGLAQRERRPAVARLLGRIPYLNGGIFERHQIEELYGEKIQIPDAAFERLFDFFDEYRWHLDERPHRDDREINPDVLGYIFEKYINQKQMGAYYTKEDITEYIAKNTIIPHLFDAAGTADFRSLPDLRNLLARDPDRYIYPAVRHGVINANGEVVPESALPDFVQIGMHDPNARMFDKRYNLQMANADDPLRLPTETWREYVNRRQRCLDLRGKLQRGEVTSINDFITFNLDIRQFAQDVIQDSDADLLLAFWKAILQIKVLDPTVGSGAFLFAALNVLAPLYEACVERMSALVEELDRSGERHSPQKYAPFRKALEQVQRHPNEAYFIYKSIVINNLYGVDIMEEAVEICKLRLFLKLAAQVDPDPAQENLGIEPLPDIDFNIRAGNTLVGFATREDVRRSVRWGLTGGKAKVQSEKLLALPEEEAQLQRIEEKSADVDRLYQLFRQQQTEYGGEVRPEDKRELQKRLRALEEELNLLLARQYGIQPPSPGRKGGGGEVAYQKWLASHAPFHWFVEFYGIMREGGFDVIIGNPPWIEYAAIRKSYQVQNYATEKTGNLYAMCMERALSICGNKGYISLIVQLPLITSSRMNAARGLLTEQSDFLAIIPFGDRPGKLFDGLEHSRSTIFISQKSRNSSNKKHISTTKFQRWSSSNRIYLFPLFEQVIVQQPKTHAGVFPKLYRPIQEDILIKVRNSAKSIQNFVNPNASDDFVFYQEATEYWIKATVGLPYYAKNGIVGPPAHGRYIYFGKKEFSEITGSLLNSNLFFMYFVTYGDCFHLSDNLVSGFPVSDSIMQDGELVDLNRKLMRDLSQNAFRKEISTKSGDKIVYDEYYGWKSKPIIDEIDRVLARHYGLTDEELDFIINYDIKYRMGGEEEA